MRETIELLLVFAASVLGAAMSIPQAIRLARTRSLDGVSGVWAGIGAFMNLWWLAYGVMNVVWAVVPVSVMSGGVYWAILIIYLREGGRQVVPEVAFGALGLGLVPLPFLIVGGWELAGLAIGLCYGVQFAPAAVTAYRTRCPVGLSGLTWLIAWTEAAIWFVYAALVSDLALFAGGVSGLAMSTVILARIASSGRRTPPSRRLPALVSS